MRLITVAGAHACGKTSVILKTSELLKQEGFKSGIVKFDCITTDDDAVYAHAGLPCLKYLSGNTCPDHCLASNVNEAFDWGEKSSLDILIMESAGLCGRCSPHIRDIPAVCVIDCLAGISSPFKLGPMLKYADYIVVTKSDLVSPAEREVFLHSIRLANKRARITFINGLSGQGAYRFANYIKKSSSISTLNGAFLRHSMPAAVCTFCSGQVKLGSTGAGGRIKWENQQ